MSLRRILLYLSLVGVLSVSVSSSQLLNRHSRNAHTSTSDYLMRIKCRAKCMSNHVSHICDYEACLKEMRGERKLGSCPKRLLATTLIGNDTSRDNYFIHSNCIDACGSWDYNCPEAERCCPNSCGMSCHRPGDLERVKVLPPVPCKLSVMESRRKIEICWDVYTEIKVGLNYSALSNQPSSYHPIPPLDSYSIRRTRRSSLSSRAGTT